jgi:biotin carboxyl carrier protein
MKLTAEIEGEQCALDVRREGASVTASVNDRRYSFTVREAGTHVFLLLDDEGRVYECRVSDTGDGAASVLIGDRAYTVQINDAKRLRRGAANAASRAGGQSKITTQMPGKVVRILVEAGAEVEAGDPVIIVEAMKMQNEMKAPRAGRVAAINVQAGATVSAGDVLLIIE